jgi:hypothetical protein
MPIGEGVFVDSELHARASSAEVITGTDCRLVRLIIDDSLCTSIPGVPKRLGSSVRMIRDEDSCATRASLLPIRLE